MKWAKRPNWESKSATTSSWRRNALVDGPSARARSNRDLRYERCEHSSWVIRYAHICKWTITGKRWNLIHLRYNNTITTGNGSGSVVVDSDVGTRDTIHTTYSFPIEQDGSLEWVLVRYRIFGFWLRTGGERWPDHLPYGEANESDMLRVQALSCKTVQVWLIRDYEYDDNRVASNRTVILGPKGIFIHTSRVLLYPRALCH